MRVNNKLIRKECKILSMNVGLSKYYNYFSAENLLNIKFNI